MADYELNFWNPDQCGVITWRGISTTRSVRRTALIIRLGMELCKAMNPDLARWAETCPDPKAVAGHLARVLFLASPAHCHECGERYTNADLREDRAYLNSGNSICRDCWFCHDSGTLAFPDYKAPPWPEHRTIDPIPMCYDGVLIDKSTGTRLGTVVAFNPKSGFCHRVIRDAYPDGAEMGSIALQEEDVIERVPTTFVSQDDPHERAIAEMSRIYSVFTSSAPRIDAAE